MGSPIARLGDTSSHGGTIVSASSDNYFADGIQVAVDGDSHSCPIPTHGVTPIGNPSPVTRSAGKGVLKVGSVAGCGAVISSGSPTITVP